MLGNPHNVQVGQVWEDVDPRMHGRQFRVHEVGETYAVVQITRPNPYSTTAPTTKRRINLTRFTPTRTGYRLIEETA